MSFGESLSTATTIEPESAGGASVGYADGTGVGSMTKVRAEPTATPAVTDIVVQRVSSDEVKMYVERPATVGVAVKRKKESAPWTY